MHIEKDSWFNFNSCKVVVLQFQNFICSQIHYRYVVYSAIYWYTLVVFFPLCHIVLLFFKYILFKFDVILTSDSFFYILKLGR